MEIVEIHAIARGKVQGVGFRYTTERIALQLDLKGSVENLRDGSVEIYAQGARQKVKDFVDAMNSHWKGYMESFTSEYLDSLNFYEGFVIKQ